MSQKTHEQNIQAELVELRSEVNMLKAELNRLENEKKLAEENSFKKSLFLAKMNHEIRTPMNSIVGFAQLLDDPDVDEETKSEFIKIITTSSQYLLDLINDIIDIAKIESNQIEINETVVSLSSFLEEIKENAYVQLDENDLNDVVRIRVKNNIPKAYDSVLIDETHLKQIMVNLVANALKFTTEGSITVSAEVENNMLRFLVADTGRGIEDDKLPLLFDYYWHIDGDLSKKYNGTGLRLTVVNLLVTLLGGTIDVKSEIGKGSEFYVSLPLKLVDDDSLQTENGIHEESEIPDFKGKTILIVEDDEYSFRLLKLLLKPTNATLLRAVDGEEAIKLSEQNKSIDLILMDMMLPRLDGLQASRNILKVRKLPIIIQTANVLHGERRKVMEAGCADYITKPINKNELFFKIKRHIS